MKYLQNKMRLKSAPGKEYHYSNLGYGILAYALSRVEDTSYESLFYSRIAEPYGKERSGISDRSIEGDEYALDFRNRAVQGLDRKGEPTPYWDLEAMEGAGALFSTVRDLSRFVKANFDSTERVLRSQQKPIHPVNDGMDMALGWHVLKKGDGVRWHWHNGGTGGFRTSLVMDLDRNQGVIVLANISTGHQRFRNIDRLGYILLQSL